MTDKPTPGNAARHDAVLNDYRRAVAALALQLPGAVYVDFKAKSDALLAYMQDASDAYTAGYRQSVEDNS